MKTFQKILFVIILQLFCVQQYVSAQDTIPVGKPLKTRFKPEPMRATMLAVSFPGLGQIYNRKYYKVPFVYAGFAGLLYSVGFNSSNYTKYMKAYQDFTDNIKLTDSYVDIIPPDVPQSSYDPVVYPETANPATASHYEDEMLRMVDYYKKYRDLSIIGIAGLYMISILDANVDASLFNYDISNNLDIAVFPVQLYLPGGYLGAGLNVSLKVTF